MNHRTPSDLSLVSPIECRFKVGDKVIFTNDYGVQFKLEIVGFKNKLDEVGPHRFIYLNSDAWWFPHDPKELEFYW